MLTKAGEDFDRDLRVSILLFYKNLRHIFFREVFRCTAKVRKRDFPYVSHSLLSKPPRQSGTILTTDEPTLMYHNHPQSQFPSQFILGAVCSMGLDKWVIYVHHFRITWSGFKDLKILCALTDHPSAPPVTSGNH